MSKSSKRRKAQERKQEKRQQKDAMRKQYQQWARDGINKKSKRRVLAAKRSRLVKDHKQVNVAAVLARPKLGKPPNWVNRKALALGLKEAT